MSGERKHSQKEAREKGPTQAFFETLQAIFTCAAIVIGAGWFFYQQENKPKANFSHKLAMVKVDNGSTNLWWGSLEVKVANVGQIPLSLNESALKITLVSPTPEGWSLEITNNRVAWPQILYSTNKSVEYVLPGEEDYRYFEFTLPNYVQTFRVFSFLKLGTKNELAWSKVSIYNIENGKITEVGTTEK
jgi:hypothetical protein